MDKLNYSGQTPFNEHHSYTGVLSAPESIHYLHGMVGSCTD
ncbi:hypothetical protein [Sphingobacterium sp. G1-14]|nr:hypothetical protein [Sphingobacterium sp. G1-14]